MSEFVLASVGEGKSRDSIEDAITLAAILRVHEEVKSSGQTFTLRELLQKFYGNVSPILGEYFIAFGKYGVEVIERYVFRLGYSEDEFSASVESKHTMLLRQLAL